MLDAGCSPQLLENLSTSRNTSEDMSSRPDMVVYLPRRQVIVVLSAGLLVLGVAFNLLVFVIFHVFDRKRSFITISNRFVLNLAAANGFMSSTILPLVLYSALVGGGGGDTLVGTRAERAGDDGSGPFSSALCKANALGTMASIAASVGATVLIAVDRLYAVSRPLHYANHITSTKAWAMIAGAWTASVAFAALPLLGWGRVRYSDDRHLCLPHWAGRTWPDRTMAATAVVVCFVLPLVLTVFVYVSVSVAARRTAAQARRNSSTSGISDHAITADRTYPPPLPPRLSTDVATASSSRNLVALAVAARRRSSAGSCTAALVFHKEDWKAAKTGAIVTLAFVACWMPFFADVLNDAVTCSSSAAEEEERQPGGYRVFFVLMAASSCVVNPLVYVFRTKAVRTLLSAACFARDGGGGGDPVVLLGSAAETRRPSQSVNVGFGVSTSVTIEAVRNESKPSKM